MERDKKRLQNERSSLGSQLDNQKHHVISIKQQVSDADENIQSAGVLKQKVMVKAAVV